MKAFSHCIFANTPFHVYIDEFIFLHIFMGQFILLAVLLRNWTRCFQLNFKNGSFKDLQWKNKVQRKKKEKINYDGKKHGRRMWFCNLWRHCHQLSVFMPIRIDLSIHNHSCNHFTPKTITIHNICLIFLFQLLILIKSSDFMDVNCCRTVEFGSRNLDSVRF